MIIPVVPPDLTILLNSSSAIVGVLDILGFKRLASTTSPMELATQFATLALVSQNIAEEHAVFEWDGKLSSNDVHIMQASDTFVMVSEESIPADLVKFLWNLSHFVYHAISMGFPVRGAIAYGDALVASEPAVFIGSAVIEAAEMEKSQSWAGACIAPSLEARLVELGLLQDLFPLVLPYSVPTNGDFECAYAVNWICDDFYYMDPDHVSTKFPESPEDDREYGKVQEKIRNTSCFLRACLKAKARGGRFTSPINRKIVFEESPDGRRSMRIILDTSS